MARRLGAVCRQARENAGLLQLDVAQVAGVSESTVHRFEVGEGWRWQTDRIVATYAQLCGVEPDELWRRALENAAQERRNPRQDRGLDG